MKVNDNVSISDDKSQEFDVFTIEAITPDGIKLIGIDRIFSPDELTIVH